MTGPTRLGPDLPDGFDSWPVEARVSWLENNRTQAALVEDLLDAADATVPDTAWPQADMATLHLLAHAVVAVRDSG